VKRSIPRLVSAAAIGGAAATTAVLALGASASNAHHGTTRNGSTPNTTTISQSSPSLTASEVYKKDSAGVVAITAQTSQGGDSGTGIVINNDGIILTNDHVVSGANSLTVAPGTKPNNTRTATIVGEDPDHDLAVIKVDPSGLGLKPLTFADSSNVSVGQAVYAIGNPYGLDETLTTGIISAVGRQISAPDGGTINDAIQTDAALNPGNSGGPLIDAQGDVIGVNSQIASDQSDSSGGQPGSTGVGFAISSNTATGIAQKIQSSGASIPSTQGQGQSGQSQQAQSSPFGSQSGGTQVDPYGQSVDPSQSGGTQVDPYGQSVDPSQSGGTQVDPYGQSVDPSQSTDPYGYGDSSGGTITIP
jgi:putative serine protease PepD